MDQCLRHLPHVPDAVLGDGAVVVRHRVDRRHPGRRASIGFGPAGSTSDTYFPQMMDESGRRLRAPQRRLGRPGRPAPGRAARRDRLRRGHPRAGRQPARGADGRQHHRVHARGAGQDPRRLPRQRVSRSPPTPTPRWRRPARSVSMWNFAVANCDLPDSFVNAVVDVVMSDNDRMVEHPQGGHRDASPRTGTRTRSCPGTPARPSGSARTPDAEIADDMVHQASN